MASKNEDRRIVQGTTPEQRQQILRNADRAAAGQSRTKPSKTH